MIEYQIFTEIYIDDCIHNSTDGRSVHVVAFYFQLEELVLVGRHAMRTIAEIYNFIDCVGLIYYENNSPPTVVLPWVSIKYFAFNENDYVAKIQNYQVKRTEQNDPRG